MEKTKFKVGDLVEYTTRLVIPDGVRHKNVILNSFLTNSKRADHTIHNEQLGIIMSIVRAGNYIGYIWFCQTTMEYLLVFEEELQNRKLND